MLKGLLNKIFGGNKANKEIELLKQQNEMLMRELRKEKAQPVMNTQGLDTSNVNPNLEVCVDKVELNNAYEIRKGYDFAEIDYNKLPMEDKIAMKAELKDDIFSSGIENTKEVCSKYPTELLQHYLISLMCANDTYHQENTNIDSFNREMIINSIDEINFDNFKEVMARKGVTVREPSKAQIEKLRAIGIDITPKTSLGASQLIESVLGKADNNPTEKQLERYNALVTRLGYQGEDYDISTKSKISKAISELQAIADEKLGSEPATKEQIRYYGQLLKACNKRLTIARKEFAHSCTKIEISKAIEELKVELATLHPEVTEGQANYIIQLHQRLMLSYNVDDIKKMTKQEGSTLIEKLNKELLYMETRRYQASLTMKAIEAMTSKEVSEMLKQIQNDRRDSTAV